MTAADNHDRAHARDSKLDLVEKRLRVADRCDKRDAVACLQPERARRNVDSLLAALDRADQNFGFDQPWHLHQRFARENGVRRNLYLQKLHMPVGKRVCFDGGRNTKRSCNLRGAQKFGVYRQAQPQVLRDQRQLAAVFGVSDAGDGVPRADFFCNQAAQQIQFVRHRHRNQQIRRIDAGFHLRCIGCTVSLDAKNVQVLARLLQGLAAAVDDRNLMSLARELFRECASDLSVTNNDYFHGKTPDFTIIDILYHDCLSYHVPPGKAIAPP